MLVEVVFQMLDALGYQAHGFVDAREALAAIREDRPSFALIMADRAMPGMSGLDLAQQVRLDRPDLPFALVSGIRDRALEASYAKLGLSSVLTKPFSRAVLATHIQQHLSRSPQGF